MHYYNEIDPYCVQWLQNLMDNGLIPQGDIDDRSIEDVEPSDLDGYIQCHFFAGIAGWPLALQMAEWPADRPCWTGSCPCQPFSAAGQQGGAEDSRHLWPAFYRLISECRPATVFGENVSSKLGRTWLAAVRHDLESVGYACGAADIPAAGLGAPHIRQRLWWVAYSDGTQVDPTNEGRLYSEPASSSRLDNPIIAGLEGFPRNGHTGNQSGRQHKTADGPIAQTGAWGNGMAYSDVRGNREETRSVFSERERATSVIGRHSAPINEQWRKVSFLECADGKRRPTQSGLRPLADGVPERVGQLRAYGNAIVPQVAATFISSYLDIMEDKVERA